MNIKYFYILSLLLLSSCSNFLTWHLDKGIHKTKSPSTSTEISTVSDIDTNYDISSKIIWTTSANEGIYGNTAYLNMKKVNNILYSVDTDGLPNLDDIAKEKEESKKEIESERDTAISELKNKFGELVIDAAGKVIEKEVDENVHSELIKKALEKESLKNE